MNTKKEQIKPVYLYPGSFCPPTIGHLSILERAAGFLPEITVICSINPNKKENWFTPEECANFWKTYKLPKNVRVETLSEIQNDQTIKTSEIVMVRGIRDETDLEQEKKVIAFNSKNFGINRNLYILSEDKYKKISSTQVRELTQKLRIEELAKYVSPMIISALLEKVLNIKNLFMVVGKPASGKSTFLKILSEKDPNTIHINTDKFNDKLKPLIKKYFPNRDLVSMALNQEDELLKVIAVPWIELLKKSLRSIPKQSNAFVEIPYGLQSNKLMFKFIGGKIIYIGCEKIKTNIERNETRGTPHYRDFIDKIPGLKETRAIVKEHNLTLNCINTNCALSDLTKIAKLFNQQIKLKKI